MAKFIFIQYLVTLGWALVGAISMAVGLGVGLKIFTLLTPKIDEIEELKKGNICVAIVMAAVIMAFGRAISEVGISLMVGGNIRGFTRVITTAISLETSKGDVELSIALGIILIFIALVVNIVLNRIQQR